MVVAPRVREIENEIDSKVRALKIWQRPKQAVLADIMQAYRDSIEVVFAECLFFQLHAEHDRAAAGRIGVVQAQENRWRAGTLWALKWASEFCPEDGGTGSSRPEELADLLTLGAMYETFVDALKRANHGSLEIDVDEGTRTIICYEGAQATAFDTSIVSQQWVTSPVTHHLSLTEESDQITSRWTAGDYRRVVRGLATHAAGRENDIIIDAAYVAKFGKADVSVPQPTLVWLDRPTQAPDCHVFDSLVLPTDMDQPLKWKLVALLDTPIVEIGQQYCALSSDLKAVALIDDYMLRLAALIDVRQYTVAASLREDRMIRRCKDALERCSGPWNVQSQVIYTNPRQEADILAKRGADAIVIELKSTLRPETPWEVCKRNEDIVHGIGQAKALVDRGVAKHGFVLTDGYRGDYACWAEALANEIPIGSLYDLEEVAADPAKAVSILKGRVGIKLETSAHQPERLLDREAVFAGWKLRLVDRERQP